MKLRTYTEMMTFDTFEDRLRYLSLPGSVGRETFGTDRYLNQRFYRSREWLSVRSEVILRDFGCDLAIDDRPIATKLLVHHMNPISVKDLVVFNPDVLNPEYLITVGHDTHNAIHYGNTTVVLPSILTPRSPGDTKLW